jgi:hypothetical protein
MPSLAGVAARFSLTSQIRMAIAVAGFLVNVKCLVDVRKFYPEKLKGVGNF